MPLIIHPSSCCDVCLEPLTYDEPRPPFAIPCGHIFCRECLHMMHPSICPLCRKPFIPDRSKKLITGEGETEEDRTALALLQRLLVLWDRDTRDEEWILLVTEVDRWLNAGNIHEPLAKAYEVLQAYHALKAERHDNHRSMRQLRRELEQRAIAQVVEKEDATAIEQSLMSQIEELHSYVTDLKTYTSDTDKQPCRTIVRYEEEKEAFRKAASTITFKDNPLPRPPQPYPLESLPSFARRYSNGYLTNGETHASTSRAAYEDQSASQSALHLKGVPIDRKGKGKAVLAPLVSQNPNQSLSSPPSRTYQVDEEPTGPKNTIIPGASPNQRFVPRSVFEDVPGAPWGSVSEVDRRLPVEEPPVPIDPYSMIEEYATEYVDGYMEGYRLSYPQAASSSRRPRAPRSSTAGPAPIQSPLLEPPVEPRASLRPQTSRPLTLGDFIGPAQDANSNVTSRSRDHRSSRRRPPREDADSNDTTSAPPPVSAPIQLDFASSSYSTGSGAIDSSWWPRTHASTSGSTTTTAPLPAPTSAPAPPISAPAQSSSFSNTSASQPSWPSNSRASNTRSRPQRRLSDMTNIETTWRPPQTSPQPSSESASSLRRRSAFSAIPVQSGSVVHSPAASVSEADRASIATSVILPLASAPHTPAGSASDRTSISSWGTVNTANPAPPSTQPIQESAHFIPANDIVSVRDLHLRSFEDVDGVGSDRASLLSDLGSLSGMGATMPPVQREQSVGLHHDDRFNETPRNSMRGLSLYDSVPAVPERRRDSHTSSYQEPEFVPPPVAPEAWYRPDLVPTPAASISSRHSYSNSTSSQHRSSRSSRRSSRPPSPPAAPYSEDPYSAPWTDVGYFTTAPVNALGLSDFAPSPELQISAPTPVTSHRSFLRSFSHDNYN